MLGHFEGLGYPEKTRKYYLQAWTHLIRFGCAASYCSEPVRHFADEFFKKRDIPSGKPSSLSWSHQLLRRAVNVLVEFQETGAFRRHPRRIADPEIPRALLRERDRYEAFCRRHMAHRPSTIASRLFMLKWFFVFLRDRGVTSARGIKPAVVTAFIAERARHVSSRSLATELGGVRSFLRFLGMRGLVRADLVSHVRGIRFAKEHRLPPVWPAAAVKALIDGADRASAVGKRNYAMLLLATRLGLRACDIVTLELGNLRWADDCITLNQRKTGKPLTLPLDNLIGTALIDYLQHARPRTAHRTVFLRVRAPHEPLTANNLYAVVKWTARKGGVELPSGVPFGTHSLRHTVATRLVQAGQRLETIAGVLGHASIEATRIYTHLDVDSLRSVALDPDEVFHAK
jgi:site-specific recombinase XerD